jgi:predicted MFS family arabinose efflux permease
LGLAAGIHHTPPAQLWLILGAVSAVIALLSWTPMGRPSAALGTAALGHAGFGGGEWRLILCYGLFGFGYIIPASFLPAMARDLVDDPGVFGWAWPLFGTVAAISTVIAAQALRHLSPRRLWICALCILTVGVLAPMAVRHIGAVLLGAVCVGGTFMVITLAGMLHARQHTAQAAKLMAAMTAAFATGQLLGPLVVGAAASSGLTSIAGPSAMAAAGLLWSAWLLQQARAEQPPAPTQKATQKATP